MKKVVGIIIVASILFSSCSQKPYYKTAEGKRKLKYYNKLQFGARD